MPPGRLRGEVFWSWTWRWRGTSGLLWPVASVTQIQMNWFTFLALLGMVPNVRSKLRSSLVSVSWQLVLLQSMQHSRIPRPCVSDILGRLLVSMVVDWLLAASSDLDFGQMTDNQLVKSSVIEPKTSAPDHSLSHQPAPILQSRDERRPASKKSDSVKNYWKQFRCCRLSCCFKFTRNSSHDRTCIKLVIARVWHRLRLRFYYSQDHCYHTVYRRH